MKKLTALFASLILVFSLAACSGTSNSNDSSNNTPSTTNSPTNETKEGETNTPTQTGDSKTLVVYYSASGNTERVAKDIASATNADIFEIEPTEIYTRDDLNWTNSDSRVSRERDNESLRDVPLKTTSVENWSNYDTVFIGYPIWWGDAAWPINNFVKANDFNGKNVIPFATSSSSGMGRSATLLSDMAKSGDWQEGHRFSSSASSSDIQAWVNELGL